MRYKIIFLLMFFIFTSASGQQLYETAKPWTYWWWMGGAVHKTDIKAHLNDFAKAGLGGVHIVPIYGVKGYEEQFKNFLSEEWLEAVEFTISEAEKLNMGVDMTLGTGWPFGGNWITKEHAAKKLVTQTINFKQCDELSLNINQITSNYGLLDLVAIHATNEKERVDLTPYLKDSIIKKKVFSSDWKVTIYGVAQTGQMVKRAAPGGEGFVLDYFDDTSADHYLHHFDSIFSITKYPINPRAFYHDSYEVYLANWTSLFLSEFEAIHNYSLLEYIHILNDNQNKDYPLIVHDIRETLSELIFSDFTKTWTEWCKVHGKISRNQAHGSPGNLLDLYGLADIPETESFGCSDFNIPGLNCDPDYQPQRFGRPSPLMMKFASSPANLLNKHLVSSETATWLADHFKVSLKRIKPQVDELFTAGINHIFYHGITYSPREVHFPGWLFYASTNFGQHAHFWDELHLLNNYIEKCQKVLQETTPDNDILLYFPINELWTKYRAENGDILLLMDVHHYDKWFSATSFGKTAELLWENGFTFDYISDKQISKLEVDSDDNVFISNTSKYQTIIIPKIDYIPKSTLVNLKNMAKQGVKIIFLDKPPRYYAGFPITRADDMILESENFIISDKLTNDLGKINISNEMLMKKGLDFIRKKNAQGYLYFITNLGNTFQEGSISLSVTYEYITITDPVTKACGYIKTDGGFDIHLPPGKSYLIQTSISKPDVNRWHSHHRLNAIPLNCKWTVTFEDYEMNKLNKAYHPDRLSSWTEWDDEGLKTFSGKARYVATFNIDPPPGENQKFILYIEEVRESAKVIINGIECGTMWSLPNQLEIDAGILKSENEIEIIVRNLSSNYMKKYDKENPGWKKFYDINMVNITYDPFTTEKWDFEPSGLIGKLHLSPIQ
jgi:hypothetical protein